MTIKMNIFKACDIRGVFGEEITVPVTRSIALAVGSKLAGEKVIVGGDNRISTPDLKDALIEGLVAAGCEVYDIGIVATPVFYFALKNLSAAGGVMVTASHNPARYNGFKLALGEKPVTEEDVAAIGRLALTMTSPPPGRLSGKSFSVPDIIGSYLGYIETKAPPIPPNSLKVVVDAGNGIAGSIAPALYRRLGYEVTELYCQSDGRFPNRPPNPALAENLTGLCRAVEDSGADFGVAFDGDGDRVAFVDEKGCPVDNDKIIVLIARHLLKKQPGTIVYDAKCSMAVPEEVAARGGRPVMARAGHTFSKAAFQQEAALFAGEISGHFFFRELGVDDAMFAGLKIGELIARSGALSAQAATVPQYLLTPDIRVEYPGDDKGKILDETARRLQKYNPNRIDGVRIEFPNGWGMIRASVTEPLFTLRFEAKSRRQLKEIAAILLHALPDGDLRKKIALQLPKECLRENTGN